MSNIRKQFPALQQTINGKPIIYFNNAATTHKPQSVIDRISRFYAHEYANVYRGIDRGGEQATTLYEAARQTVADLIGAQPHEIIFTKNTTESINFIATAWATRTLKPGDEIVITQMEHHANLIPWQQVAKQTGAVLKYIPVTQKGILDLTTIDSIITEKTKLVSVVHVSNLLGTQNDITTLTQKAHTVGAPILIDAAQSIAHQRLDVKDIGCDFLAFSGHKMLAPTGIGVLYINEAWHNAIEPYQFGGGMVSHVDYQQASWQEVPQKYEAGTPPIAQAIGLAAAIDFLKQIDFNELANHEAHLTRTMIDGLAKMEGIRIVGPIDQLKQHGHMVSFTVNGMHAHDVAAYLDQHGIAVRAGHACAQPLAQKLNLEAVIRASFYLYNTLEEIERFLAVMQKLPR